MLKSLLGILAKRRVSPTPSGNVQISGTPDAKNATGSTVHNLTSVPAGALLVLTTSCENAQTNCAVSSSPSLTWTKRADSTGASSGDAEIHTTLFSAGGNITVTSNWGAGNSQASVCYVVINTEPLLGGASATAANQTVPNITISSSRANSIFICVSSDWNAINGASRVYLSTPIETQYFRSAADFTAYHYYKIAPSVTSYTLGLSSPTGMSAGTCILELRSSPPIGPDVNPPTAPVLSTSSIGSTSIGLTWIASTDDFGVSEYDIYVDGAFVISTTATIYTLNGLTPLTQYSIYVKAKDLAGNNTDSNIITPTTTDTPPPSSVQGFGVNVTGGQGGTTVIVSNLNATGAGSLYNAILNNPTASRTIVFTVEGTINGFSYDSSNNTVVKNLTIDGTTAPGNGITLNNADSNCLSFQDGCDNIIVKGLRMRNAGNDGINFVNATNFVVDHCSFSGNGDGHCDVTNGSQFGTIQYCIFGGGQTNWGGPMLIAYSGTNNISVHHNFFSPRTAPGTGDSAGERCPYVHSNDTGQRTDLMADIRNNLVWNWGRDNGTGSGLGSTSDYGAAINVVNNYYKTNTAASLPENAVTRGSYGQPVGNMYAAGNVSGNQGGGTPATSTSPNAANNHAEYTVPAQYQITMETACEAATTVLAEAGCFPRDSIDTSLLSGIILSNCP